MRRTNFSLRRQLFVWLLIPQIVSWLFGTALAYLVAVHFAGNLIDLSLSQTARSLVSLVHQEDDGHLEVDFDRVYRMLVSDNQLDSFYYSVTTLDGELLLGNRRLELPPNVQSIKDFNVPQIYYDSTIEDEPVRVVAVIMPITHDSDGRLIAVQVAKTVFSRNDLYWRIFLWITLPMCALTLIGSGLVWLGIGRGLRPLARLQSLVGNRAAEDLSPIELSDAPAEVRGLTASLNHLLDATRLSIEHQRRFIADAAHQLRTPLAGLKSQTELAMRENTPENLRARLNMVHTSATRSIHLVNQLLTLARSEQHGRQNVAKVDMDLAKVVRELTAEAVPRALAAGMDLGCDSELMDAPLIGNPALLREMLLNLVENAIKYGCHEGSITVRLQATGQNYLIEVEDNGPGIPNEDKERVFERFYRRTQDGNGCGLGMAIVKEIVERHEGWVELRDAEPQGLIVHMEFPRHPTLPSPTPAGSDNNNA